MPGRALAAGIASGIVLAAGGIAAIDIVSEPADAQGGANDAALKAANDRSIRAIKQGTRAWNLVAKYLAEPGERVGVKSPRVSQEPGVGSGIPLGLLSEEARQALGAGGPPGATGPPGPMGATGPQGPSRAFSRQRISQVSLGAFFEPVLTLDLPAGSYLAESGVQVNVSVGDGFDKAGQCRMTDPNGEQQTSRVDIGAAQSAIIVNSQAFETSGETVSVTCRVFGGMNPMGFTSVAWIRAIEVADLTIQPEL